MSLFGLVNDRADHQPTDGRHGVPTTEDHPEWRLREKLRKGEQVRLVLDQDGYGPYLVAMKGKRKPRVLHELQSIYERDPESARALTLRAGACWCVGMHCVGMPTQSVPYSL